VWWGTQSSNKDAARLCGEAVVVRFVMLCLSFLLSLFEMAQGYLFMLLKVNESPCNVRGFSKISTGLRLFQNPVPPSREW
jgi:hypothetical protein